MTEQESGAIRQPTWRPYQLQSLRNDSSNSSGVSMRRAPQRAIYKLINKILAATYIVP